MCDYSIHALHCLPLVSGVCWPWLMISGASVSACLLVHADMCAEIQLVGVPMFF